MTAKLTDRRSWKDSGWSTRDCYEAARRNLRWKRSGSRRYYRTELDPMLGQIKRSLPGAGCSCILVPTRLLELAASTLV